MYNIKKCFSILTLCSLLLLTSCTNQVNFNSTAGDIIQYGYLGKSDTGVYFFQWTEFDKKILGQLYSCVINNNYKLESTQISITGQINNQNITIEFADNTFWGSIMTGIINNDGLSLITNTKDGKIATLTFGRDTVDTYNSLVDELQSKIDNHIEEKEIKSDLIEPATQQKSTEDLNGYRKKAKLIIRDIVPSTMSSPQEDAKENELWIVYPDGKEELLVKSVENNDMNKMIIGIKNPQMSLDGTKVYFESMTWLTSNNVFVVDIGTKKIKTITDGWDIKLINTGTYKGKLGLYTRKDGYGYMGVYTVYDDDGNELHWEEINMVGEGRLR